MCDEPNCHLDLLSAKCDSFIVIADGGGCFITYEPNFATGYLIAGHAYENFCTAQGLRLLDVPCDEIHAAQSGSHCILSHVIGGELVPCPC
jgi:hypothetical protein